jgi:hypothetical protein
MIRGCPDIPRILFMQPLVHGDRLHEKLWIYCTQMFFIIQAGLLTFGSAYLLRLPNLFG